MRLYASLDSVPDNPVKGEVGVAAIIGAVVVSIVWRLFFDREDFWDEDCEC